MQRLGRAINTFEEIAIAVILGLMTVITFINVVLRYGFGSIHITDTIMLGWYDVTALAAVTIAGTAFFVTFIVGAGFAMAVTPLVAAAEEEGNDTQVRRITRMGLWLSVMYGAVFTIDHCHPSVQPSVSFALG